MKNNVHAFTSRSNNLGVLNVPLNPLDAELVQPFVPLSADHTDVDAVIEQLLDNVQTKKSSPAGHQCFHNKSEISSCIDAESLDFELRSDHQTD